MDPLPSQTSTTLLRQVADGQDHQADRAFFERYSRLARSVAAAAGVRHAHDLDDIVQETMAAAMQALREGKYQRDKGGFRVWFKGVLRHKIADAKEACARSVRTAASLPDAADCFPGPAEQFDQAYDAQWQSEALNAAFDLVKRKVSQSTWESFYLVECQHWLPGEVAARLGITTASVYLHCFRVKRQLKKIVAAMD